MKIKEEKKSEAAIPQQGFYFDKEHHRYYLDGRQMTGVTTVLDVLAKPALIQWAANQAVESLKTAEKDSLGNYLITEELLEVARKAHAQKRDKAADRGTLAHAWMAKWINASMGKAAYPESEPELMPMIGNFLKWVAETKPKFLDSEKIVYSAKYFYAGTLDFICEIENKNYLGDIKTGSGIYREMFLQTSGYQIAFEEQEPKVKIDGHIIVNVTKDGKLNVKENFDYEGTKQGFLSALTLYRLLNNQ